MTPAEILRTIVGVHHRDWCEDGRTECCWLILADGRVAGYYHVPGLPDEDVRLRIIEGAEMDEPPDDDEPLFASVEAFGEWAGFDYETAAQMLRGMEWTAPRKHDTLH